MDHNKNTKISDFGLSRSLRDLGSEMYEQKTKGALPIRSVPSSASKSSIRRFVITEKAPTRAFSWLKVATTAFKFKTLC